MVDFLGRIFNNLFYATRRNNETKVRRLIEAGADVNKTNAGGQTPLFYAVENKHLGIVRALIAAGADVNVVDEDGKAALFYAVESEHNGIIRALLDGGAGGNSKYLGRSALLYAMENKYFSIVPTLIDSKKFEIDADDDDVDKTPLFYAIENGNISIARALINAGANIHLVCFCPWKAGLSYAVEKENEDLVHTLIDAGAEVDNAGDQGKTALFYAADNKSDHIVRALVNAGIDVNITEYIYGKTALFQAVANGNKCIVRALIGAGADVNITDDDGKTALFYAIENNQTSMVRELIAADEGKEALFYAVQNSYHNMVCTLISFGVNVNGVDLEGQTALFYAVENQDLDMIRTLVEDGKAFVNARDLDGRTPLFYAIKDSRKVSEYLIEKGGNLYLKDNCNLSVLELFIGDYIENNRVSILSSKAFPLHLEPLMLFRKHGIQPQDFVRTIVSYVFCKIPLVLGKKLIQELGDSFYSMDILCDAVNVAKQYSGKRNKQKKRIFDDLLRAMRKKTASKTSVTEILDLLFQLGANPVATDSLGCTALHYASLSFFRGGVSKDIVLAMCYHLRGFGLSFNAKKYDGETPLHLCLSSVLWTGMASQFSEDGVWPERINILVEVCKCLLENGASPDVLLQNGESIFHLLFKLFQQVLGLDHSFRQDLLEKGVALLKFLLQKSNNWTVNRGDEHLDTPLHFWASLEINTAQEQSDRECNNIENFLEESLKLLLEGGALRSARNENEETPLHLCRTWCAVKLLIKAGANPNDLDSSGRSPLLAAAKNKNFLQNEKTFFPDVKVHSEKFWSSAIKKGLNPWIVDKDGESVLGITIKNEAYLLAKALVDVACEENYIQSKETALSLLNAICKDRSAKAKWKTLLVETVVNAARNKNIQVNVEVPLGSCCRNIIELGVFDDEADDEWEEPLFKRRRIRESLSEGTTSQFIGLEPYSSAAYTSVHCKIAKLLLRLQIRDNKIPISCMEIAATCPKLKSFLLANIDTSEDPKSFPWTSVSKRYEKTLSKVARQQECEKIDSFCYYKEHIARGSFGCVFLGINEKDGREVAIKRIEKARIRRPKDKREITNLTAVADCEQVVRYFSFTETKDFSFIVLELMEGNLDEYLDGSHDAAKSVKLCRDLVTGLKYLHDRNIIHRDLKPTNILYKTHPRLCLKIADFGLSRRIDSTFTTVYGTNAGTRCWIAPELLKSTTRHSKPSDIFSCGLILHYILSVKKHPFTPASRRRGELEIINQTEANIMKGLQQGWDNSLLSEPTHLIKMMLHEKDTQRPTAVKALAHTMFWSCRKKIDFLKAVGNQEEFRCPRNKRSSLSTVESELEKKFHTVVGNRCGSWYNRKNLHMRDLYNQMSKRRKYDTRSVVELVRLIRNAYQHSSEINKQRSIKDLLFKDFGLLEYFPNLVLEVYKTVTAHLWHETRDEVSYALYKN